MDSQTITKVEQHWTREMYMLPYLLRTSKISNMIYASKISNMISASHWRPSNLFSNSLKCSLIRGIFRVFFFSQEERGNCGREKKLWHRSLESKWSICPCRFKKSASRRSSWVKEVCSKFWQAFVRFSELVNSLPYNCIIGYNHERSSVLTYTTHPPHGLIRPVGQFSDFRRQSRIFSDWQILQVRKHGCYANWRLNTVQTKCHEYPTFNC